MGAAASGVRVSEACRAGREQECKKVQIVESWKLMGAIAGSSAGPVVVGKTCAAVGKSPHGLLVCAVVAAGVGAIGGGLIGETIGEGIGELVYAWTE